MERKRGVEAEPEGETETLEVIVLWNEADGVSVNPEGEAPRADTSKKY